MTHLLSWQCGMGRRDAGRWVSVPQKLRELPVTSAAFESGKLSLTQVEAIGRVATPATDASYVKWASLVTAAQLEQLHQAVMAPAQRHQVVEPVIAAVAPHEGGFTVERRPEGMLVFTDPWGRVLPDAPELPAASESAAVRHRERGLAIDDQTCRPTGMGDH